MKRNGYTKAGKQRWRCKACNASTTYTYDKEDKDFSLFIDWLFSKKCQDETGNTGRTFRQKIQVYWSYWPLSPIHEQKEKVIYVDGLYIARNVVILISSCNDGVIGWYLSRGESAHAWMALLHRVHAPELVVTDGGTGFERARKMLWTTTKVQRCLYHIFCQIRRLTTSRPRLPAGQELYNLAIDLLHINTAAEANEWVQQYIDWSKRWNTFLREKTYDEHGHWTYTHKHLHQARNSLNKLISKNVLFTYLEKAEYPSTNNSIEGGVNAQLRAMLRDHRGMPLTHRIKAVFWWCYMHCPQTLKTSEALKTMPTDKQIACIYQRMTAQERKFDELPNWGDAIVWSEFHSSNYMPWD